MDTPYYANNLSGVGGGKMTAYNPQHAGGVVPKDGNSWKGSAALVAALVVAIIVAVVVLIVAVPNGDSNSDNEKSVGLSPPTGPPGSEPTRFPTKFTTLRPTVYPTGYPTAYEGPPTTDSPTTSRPTTNPTFFPTVSPVTACTDPDAVCGCDKVSSTLVDIVFLVDESGSVGTTNYALMKAAIRNFVLNVDPPYGLTDGTRFMYIEFSGQVNDQITFNQFITRDLFLAKFDSFTFTGVATNQRAAFLRVAELLNNGQNSLRPGSQLLLVLMTDGNPCVSCNGFCCSNSNLFSGVDILRSIRDQFPLTFYFLPIKPGDGSTIKGDTYNAAIGQLGDSPGLSPDEFRNFTPQNFDQLDEFLTNTFNVPLGPCVDPPTVSASDRRLFEAEAMLTDSGAIKVDLDAMWHQFEEKEGK